MSHESHCDLTSLHCGQHYTATVVAQDSDCTSPMSDTVELKTVPCIPASVSTVMDCAANTMSVWWLESSGADSYTATLQDSDRRTTTCQALSGPASCNVTGLSCGQIYHVTVAASDGYCSRPSTGVTDTRAAIRRGVPKPV
ncbi:fibronectin type III domain-containing protein 7-like [Coregonus clupeaformis]|uniref:fibronectin type III domain-containing protein 7-like n=1 Tax=Coregonus clupeaformis TaxID=59861 RepID=UPI001E1C4B12|nr:fibronectin type III domain-containing protein 7-like [Coregonus clupeaformis]